MPKSASILETSLKSLPFLYRGKVRDIYEVDAERLLVVQTDRLSAFDVILPTPVPGKGRMLTAMSTFWFHRLAHIIANHLLPTRPESVVASLPSPVTRCRLPGVTLHPQVSHMIFLHRSVGLHCSIASMI